MSNRLSILVCLAMLHPLQCFGVSAASFSPAPPPAGRAVVPLPDNYETRVCNKTVPLPGGIEAADASEEDFRAALRTYHLAESKIERGSSFGTMDRTAVAAILTASGGDEVTRQYVAHRFRGSDYLNMRRFVQVFLVRKLLSDGKYDEALNEVAMARRDAPIVARDVQIDEGDQATHLQTQTSDNALLLWELVARMRLANPGTDGLAVVLDYLAIRNKIWSTMELFHQTDIDKEMLEIAGVTLASVDPATPESWPTAVVAAWPDRRDRIVTLSGRKSTRVPVTFRLVGSGDDADVKLLSGEDAYRNYESYVRSSLAAVPLAPNDPVLRVSFLCDGSGCEIVHESGSITLSRTEVDSLLRGVALPADHKFSLWLNERQNNAILAVANPFQQRITAQRQLTDAILYSLQENYPSRLIARAKPTDEATGKTARLYGLKRPAPSDIVALVPDDSFDVNDRAIVNNMEEELQKGGIRVEKAQSADWKWEHESGKTVIVITGHSDQALAEYLKYLGERNAFRGNIVVLNSCGTAATRELADIVNRDYGAQSTLVFQKRIQAHEVETFLGNLLGTAERASDEPLASWVLRSSRSAKLKGIWSIAHLMQRREQAIYSAGHTLHG